MSGGGNNEFGMTNRSKTAKFKNMLQLRKPEIRFLTLRAKWGFVKLKQVFIKTSILNYFDLK